MMNEIKEKFGSVENAFNLFVVQDCGGELAASLYPVSESKPQDADYFFRYQNVIVELKCLMKDHFQNEEDYEATENRIKKALESGRLTEEEVAQWNPEEKISENIRRIILSGIQKTIEGSLRDAKHQIEETRRVLQIPDAIGLLFFANDLNSFPPLIHEQIIEELIVRKYQNDIHGFVYFSTDRVMEMYDENASCIYWRQYDWIKNKELQKTISDFIDNVGRKWSDFVAYHTGRSSRWMRHSDTENIDEQMAKAKYVSGMGKQF